MGRLRVLVLDNDDIDGGCDPASALSTSDVEIVGTLKISSRFVPGDAAPAGDRAQTGLAVQPVLRETAMGLVQDPRGGPTEDTRGASAGGVAPPNRDPAVYLTRTELDVLRLLAKGLRNKDIAKELYISVNTVKTHVASIFRKLRVKNRSQAVMFVYSRGGQR